MFRKMRRPADQHRSKVRSQTKTFRAVKSNSCVSIWLLFGCILIAFTSQTFSADTRCCNVNASTNLAGGNMTNAAAPADQKTMLRDSADSKADSLSKAPSGASPRKSFRLLDGALISVGASDGSFQWLDREPTGFSDFSSSRSWAAPDANRQQQGLRLFKWSWK
jgi:hypothetical protein